jgi:hypothetical protein
MALNNNYSQVRAKFGGYIGSIQVHSTPYISNTNDPNSSDFIDNIPGGFLKCDGSVKNASDFYALSQVIGVGSNCKFKKDNVVLREPDEETGDLGQFQLPDLGSKVVTPNRSTGDYLNIFVGDTDETRVGPAVEVICNEGTQLTCDFLGNFEGIPVLTTYAMKSNPKYSFDTQSTSTLLDIENFQGHAHSANTNVLNFTANHQTGGDGKDNGQQSANSGSGNELEVSNLNTSSLSQHAHKIGKPITYSSSFAYSHVNFPIPADNVNTTLNVSVENINALNEVVTPFIIVTYIIKI